MKLFLTIQKRIRKTRAALKESFLRNILFQNENLQERISNQSPVTVTAKLESTDS